MAGSTLMMWPKGRVLLFISSSYFDHLPAPAIHDDTSVRKRVNPKPTLHLKLNPKILNFDYILKSNFEA